MKRIRKLAGPTDGLADYLATEKRNPSWAGFRSHRGGKAYGELRGALVDLQHGLCAYCEIGLTAPRIQIEHVIPQSRGKANALDAANMTACCLGGTKSSTDSEQYSKPVPKNRSCGEEKENKTIPAGVDPRELPALPALTRVDFRGRIEADAEACASCGIAADRVNETISMLGLNVKRLRAAREKRWNNLKDKWDVHRQDAEIMADAAREELLPEDDGRLRRFFTTARSYFAPLSESILAAPPQAWV